MDVKDTGESINKTDYKNLYKIRLRELKENQFKHLVVKTLLVQKLLIKYKSNRKWIRVYTEINLGKRICDIYFENLKTKEIYIYEIQENITKEWEKETIDFYNNYEVYNMTTDLVIINLKKLSDNLYDLYDELDEYIM